MKLWRALGITVQALVMGVLLYLAIIVVVALESGARVFKYQGF